MGIGGFGGSAGSGTTTKKAKGIGGFSGGGGSSKDDGLSLDDIKKAGGNAASKVGKALSFLDIPRAALLAEGRQVGRVLQGKGLDIEAMRRQIEEREGIGDLVEGADLPMNVKRAIGLAGDIATDPLTYMTFGIGGGVRLASEGVEQGAKKISRLTADQAARELDDAGSRAAANKVLKRRSVNALSAEEAAELGVRQGPTIGLGGRRVAIPGGDVAARKVSDALAPVTERLHDLVPLRGRTSEAAKAAAAAGGDEVALLRLKDAERTSRLTAKGMQQAHLGQLNRVLKEQGDDPDSVRAALEGTGGSNPTAVKLRGIMDSVAARTEELTGRRVPRVEHYLPHRLTDEAKAAVAAGSTGRGITRGTTAVMTRAYKAGDEFMGVELVDGSVDEMNRIAADRGLDQLWKDDPIELVKAYIDEMKRYAERAGTPFRLSTDEVVTKAVAAPGSRAAKKQIKALEKDAAARVQDVVAQLGKAKGMDPDLRLAQADELEGKAQELYGKGTVFDGPRISNPAVEKGAAAYNKKAGLPAIKAIDPELRVDDDFATRAAQAYDELPDVGGPEARASYAALAKEVEDQYDHLTKTMGIKVEFVDADPYADAAEMMLDVRQNKRLKVYKTAEDQSHPFFTPEQNDKFRAVHDFFGHAGGGNRFDRHGEEIAFRRHAQMFSEAARPAMATETRGQNAYLNYHPDNVARKAAGEQAQFPPQKAALLPEEFTAIVPTPNDLSTTMVKKGGFTINPKTGAVPKKGFAVSVKGAEQAFPPPATPEELSQLILAYTKAHADDFADEAAHLGGWVDNESGQLFLDVTRILPDRGAAEQFGREQGQLAIFDLAKRKEVRLPGPAASVGGSPSGVGSGAEPVPVAAPVSAEFAARVTDLRGQLEAVEKKIKSNAKELANPKLGPAAKAGFTNRASELEARKAAIFEQVKSLQAQVRNENRTKVVEQSPPFDHVVAATNTEAAAVEAAENLAKLEALREATARRASEKKLAETAAREEADALFAEAVKLRAMGEDERAIIASLHAMVAKTEADLGKLDGELGSLRALANRKKIVVDGKAMAAMGLRDLGQGRYAEPWVADAVAALDEALKPENVRGLLKTFDKVSTYWRATALLSPGFHERNFLGGMFNNSLARMQTRRYYDFSIANRQFKRGGLEAIKDKEVREAMDAAMRLGQYEGADISDVSALSAGEGGRIVGLQNPAFRANRRAGQVVERNLRMPLFIDTFIKTRGNEQAALDAVMTYHFDYDDLSRLERTVARRTFAFYTWTRKNLPLQLLNMVDQPGRYTAYLHLKNNVEQGTPEDEVVPSFFERQMAIRLPFKADGGRIYAMPELPFINTSEALGVEEMAASLSPIIKTPLEALTNHKFYEQRQFKSGLEETPKVWIPVLQVLRLAGGKAGLPRVYKANDGSLMMSEHEAAKIESLLPVLARMRRLAPSEKKYQDRAMTSWLSFAFGISTRTLDEATVGGEMLRRKGKLQRSASLEAQLAGGAELAAYKAAEAARKRREAAR